MIAYREVIDHSSDLERIFEILKILKQKSEIIILPLDDNSNNKEFIEAQNMSLESTWDNKEDEVWDAL